MGDTPHAPRAGPLRHLAYAVIVGILLGWSVPHVAVWLLLAAPLATVAIIRLRRRQVCAAAHWALLAVVALSAAWYILRVHHTDGRDLRRFVAAEPQLAEVVGVIDGPPWLRSYDVGPFGEFNWEPPATLFTLRTESIVVQGQPQPVRGGLLVRVDAPDAGVREGQRVRCRGWLGRIEPPLNPGDFNHAAAFADRGIFGRLSLPTAAVCERLADPPLTPLRALRQLRWWCARTADRSLALGLEGDPARLALLRTLLLGQRSGDLSDVREQFRLVGLSHILSISGAHMVILMALVCGVARLLLGRPSQASAVALAVLLVYLMAIPAYVPVVRAGIASSVFLLAYASGRRVAALDLLALASVIVLAWRPMDLFAPGFQLSFGGVLALLLWTRPVAAWLYPPPAIPLRVTPWWDRPARWGVEACAASLVAFALTLPVVAFHFGVVNPLAALLSVLALVPVMLLLWAGYVKVLVGAVLPSVSLVLAGPVAWLTDTLLSLVANASRWPLALLRLPEPAPLAWTAGALLVVAALFAGRFARRPAAAGCVGVGLVLWLAAPPWVGRAFGPAPPAAELTMIAVGDGSCFVLRLPDADHTLMFDCGSAAYLDVGERSVVPALHAIGVDRIDTLVISHADLDHFSGVLDVADALPVGRVLLPPQLLAHAADSPGSSAAFLLEQLRQRDLPLITVTRGWTERHGGAVLDALWPPADYRARISNDHSIVLSTRVAGRRILLHGDAQQDPLTRLLALDDLDADVTDLPHHGSYVDASPAWLAAVAPAVALQSSGHARLRNDKWEAAFAASPHIRRLVTAYDGMSTVTVDAAGGLTIRTFRETPAGNLKGRATR